MSRQSHVLITGGSSGIGKATAMIYAKRGANLTIIARRTDVLETAKHEIDACRPDDTGQTVTLSADVTNQDAVRSAFEVATAGNGPVDIVIASAGIAVPGYVGSLPLGNFRDHMEINYFGALHITLAALPAMQARQEGHITYVSSGAGLIGIFGYGSYSPTKFALRGLAEAIRGELKTMNIKISVVYPPDTDTPQYIEENKTKPAETKIMTGTAKLFSADAVAQRIVVGIDKGKFAITPGWQMTVLYRFGSVLRPLLDYYFDTIVRRMSR